MKIFILLIFFSCKVFALEAVVTVLETPLFKDRSYDAPVVQYLRKGDVIKIHPSVANDRRFDQYAPSPEKLKALKEKMKTSPEYIEDQLFSGEEKNTYYIEDEFIPTLDRQGHTVWVLSEHIYVYFGDSREFEQRVSTKDPTDYRLEEPLPRNYPLKTVSGYRGQFILGITQPYVESYPYRQNIKRKGYNSPIELNISFFRQAPGEYNKRLFIGGTMGFKTFSNSYSFADRRFSEERNYKFGLGPTISYDAFKGDKNRINLSGTIIVNLIDRFQIKQRLDDKSDQRVYTGYSLAPKLSLQYHRKQIFPDIDFVLGTSMEVGFATSYRAQDGGSQEGWWNNLGDDKFTSDTLFTLGGYIGIQSAY